MTWYVNMTDRFMSGWGGASKGKSLYCVQCDTYEQAEAVLWAAEARPEMLRPAIAANVRKHTSRDHVRVVHVTDVGGPWLRFFTPEMLAQLDADRAERAREVA